MLSGKTRNRKAEILLTGLGLKSYSDCGRWVFYAREDNMILKKNFSALSGMKIALEIKHC